LPGYDRIGSAAGQDHHAFDIVAQLADIARPVVGPEEPPGHLSPIMRLGSPVAWEIWSMK